MYITNNNGAISWEYHGMLCYVDITEYHYGDFFVPWSQTFCWEFFTGPKLPNYNRESAEISYFVGSCSLL